MREHVDSQALQERPAAIRAAIFEEVGKPLSVRSVPDPEPGPGQLLVRVARCGICGSDLHMTQGHGYTVPAGTVLGHELTGEVVDIGVGVEGFARRERVAAMPIAGCGNCRYCLAGEPARCVRIEYLFGGYAEFALVSAVTAMKLPAMLSDADGALAEPLAVALHGIAMARLAPGAKVLILGAGPIGLSALFWARKLGAGVVDVVERAEVRAEIARKMGAGAVNAPQPPDPAALMPGADPEAAYDVVIECVGRPGLLMQALAALRVGGTIISLGYCFEPDGVVPSVAGQREARIIFPQLYTVAEFRHALDVLDGGAVEPRHMVTRTVPLGGLPDMFEALRSNPAECKVLINPMLEAA